MPFLEVENPDQSPQINNKSEGSSTAGTREDVNPVLKFKKILNELDLIENDLNFHKEKVLTLM